MPAISFSGTTSMGPFWSLILEGIKTQTCRTPRRNPVKQGDKLFLYWKQRTSKKKKPIHRIAVAVCTSVKRLSYIEFAFDNAFAHRDGFANFKEMQEWFGEPFIRGHFMYDVISFKLVSIPFKYLICDCGWQSEQYPYNAMFAGPAGQLSCPECTKDKLNWNLEVYGFVKVASGFRPATAR